MNAVMAFVLAGAGYTLHWAETRARDKRIREARYYTRQRLKEATDTSVEVELAHALEALRSESVKQRKVTLDPPPEFIIDLRDDRTTEWGCQ